MFSIRFPTNSPKYCGKLYPTVSGILIVVAPALITASITRHKKSNSERPASSGENSILSVYFPALLTALTAFSITCSGSMRNFSRICIGDVARKVWIRKDFAGFSASAAQSMSLFNALAKPQTVLSVINSDTDLTASKSPGLAIGKPASIISTCIFSNAFAIRSFSSLVIEAPGLCSPSRKVVSKIINLSCIFSCCPMTT